MKCRLNTDSWDDLGVEYIVLAYSKSNSSTAVKLELEAQDGTIVTRSVASHQIEWIDDES